ncbi:MAG: SprT family zinc-dependent metalloprotease [Paracoccus sp. (in: a-proteobacteria)]|uniref:M48 family metallopeptidase n=1 Tax=Paracoccus sp. TaxID=267 RepID=UPI0026E0F406|nr:SprT family zinc-dependent metalloprotease [Paracoccus sp. (in: a-proteobacteria)]MDO5621054.1 SprT family zinc-dependent metalloprotease [Paracoccus sp. (in: a-proteobacteria)]
MNQQEIIIGQHRVQIRRHARARRIVLRVARSTGAVTLSLPPRMALAEAQAFLHSKASWLDRTAAALPGPVRVGAGVVLPVAGQGVVVTPAPVRVVTLQDEALLVPENRAIGATVQGWLRHRAHEALRPACDRFAAALGRQITAISLRDTRSRWGSCTHDGRLMFSWRLAMAPPVVLEYVAAHEVAHLAHMDHSPAFWATCESLMPGHAPHRAWLRAHGSDLLRWQFRD